MKMSAPQLLRRSHAIHLSRLSPNVTRPLLYELFTTAVGPIAALFLAPANAFALLEFVHAGSARYACALLDGTPLCGSPLCVRPSGDPSGEGFDVRVRRLAEGIDARALEALFSLCDDGGGGGVRARVIPPPSGSGAPSAFITLPSLAGALRAVEACGGVRLGGVPLEVELAKRHAGAPPPALGAWGEWRGERLPLPLLPPRARRRGAAALDGPPPGAALPLTPELLRAALLSSCAAAAALVERGVALEALADFRFSEEAQAAAAADDMAS
jgi:hypothetical protein